MKKLTKKGFSGATALSKDEMKNVMGGVVSTNVALDLCLKGVEEDLATLSPNEANAIRNSLINGCYTAYNEMNNASPYNGNH